MAWEELLIVKGISQILDFINEIQNSVLNGIMIIALFVGIFWFILYYLIWQGYFGHLTRTLILLGIWVFFEFANLVGGGHSN